MTEIATKAILTPKNTNVDLLNDEPLSRMHGVEICLLSVDSVEDSNDTTNRADLFPVEFLNSLNIAGMPPHKLRLKIGIPVILLRNQILLWDYVMVHVYKCSTSLSAS